MEVLALFGLVVEFSSIVAPFLAGFGKFQRSDGDELSLLLRPLVFVRRDVPKGL